MKTSLAGRDDPWTKTIVEIESREFCQDNPEDPSCGEDPEPGPAPGSDTDCSLYPDTPECGALPPEGVDVDCSDPANMSLPQCMNQDMYEEPPGEESPPPGENMPPPGEESPPPGEESPPPGGP